MTENVSYKRCVCDICGKEEHISQGKILPKDWEIINIGRKTHDVCVNCLVKVDMAVEDLKENKKPKKSNTGTGCIYNNVERDWDFCK